MVTNSLTGELYTDKEVCSEIEFPTEFAIKIIVFWDVIQCNFFIKGPNFRRNLASSPSLHESSP